MIVDEKKLFALDYENWDVSVSRFGHNNKFQAIIIDNFYKNPADLYDFSLAIPWTAEAAARGNLPGWRTIFRLNLVHLQRMINDLVNEFWDLSNVSRYYSNNQKALSIGEEYAKFSEVPNIFNGKLSQLNFDQTKFILNAVNSDLLGEHGFQVENKYLQNTYEDREITDLGKSAISLPHYDPAPLVCQIFLNKPEDCIGGTVLYRHKRTQTHNFEEYIDYLRSYTTGVSAQEYMYKKGQPHYVKPDAKVEWLNPETVEDWEPILKLKMKYNRAVLYSGRIWHAPWIPNSFDFSEVYRLGQMIFLQKGLNILDDASIVLPSGKTTHDNELLDEFYKEYLPLTNLHQNMGGTIARGLTPNEAIIKDCTKKDIEYGGFKCQVKI